MCVYLYSRLKSTLELTVQVYRSVSPAGLAGRVPSKPAPARQVRACYSQQWPVLECTINTSK